MSTLSRRLVRGPLSDFKCIWVEAPGVETRSVSASMHVSAAN